MSEALSLLATHRPLSVEELNQLARQTLERGIPPVTVRGEVSNLARPASGHLYFTLKDARAQVRCTMWRSRAQIQPFRLENGMQVEARASVTLYEPRGDYQLSVESLRAAGSGNLFEAFLRLKQKLETEGLFDPAHKRPLPDYPQRIGVITSPAAAALHDVLAALARRAPGLQVILYPAPVQGEDAAAKLTQAVATASARAQHDGIETLLIVRGGGSLEDLQAFNDEALARAIHACDVPVVSGVGHETDFTITDFVADLRAPTPTAAAELASAGYQAASERLTTFERALHNSLQQRLNTAAQRTDRAALRLLHPRERLSRSNERLIHSGKALIAAMSRRHERERMRCDALALRLAAVKPRFDHASERSTRLSERLASAAAAFTTRRQEQLSSLAARLETLSPQATLARGFGIVRTRDGEIVRHPASLAIGEPLAIELANGNLNATVTDPCPKTEIS